MAPCPIFIRIPLVALLFASSLALPLQALDEREVAPIQQNFLSSRGAEPSQTNTAFQEVEIKQQMIRNAMERAVDTKLGKRGGTPIPHDGCRPPKKPHC
ncbi:hypothetical protein B0O99DRAFT_618828 [Bisporella sp. PMI_857]|nr:hypothetical protein B0O99DRAFT_618828 [Bisporella sp. PMI_857]